MGTPAPTLPTSPRNFTFREILSGPSPCPRIIVLCLPRNFGLLEKHSPVESRGNNTPLRDRRCQSVAYLWYFAKFRLSRNSCRSNSIGGSFYFSRNFHPFGKIFSNEIEESHRVSYPFVDFAAVHRVRCYRCNEYPPSRYVCVPNVS